jgi:hypothetical protein
VGMARIVYGLFHIAHVNLPPTQLTNEYSPSPSHPKEVWRVCEDSVNAIVIDAGGGDRVDDSIETFCRCNGRHNLRRHDLPPRHNPHPSLRPILLPPHNPSPPHNHRPHPPRFPSTTPQTPRHVPHHRQNLPHRRRHPSPLPRSPPYCPRCRPIRRFEFRGLRTCAENGYAAGSEES